MSYKLVQKLPDEKQLFDGLNLSSSDIDGIKKHRLDIENILAGSDSRLLLIIGPCSAWPSSAVLEYASLLAMLNDKVRDKIKLVMRTYIQKPRTVKGWTGPINQPDPQLPPDIVKGIRYCRELMLHVIRMGLPIADEALFTHNARGFLELLSWVAIGARSGEDQEHRIFASSLDLPVGIKNPTHGSLKIGVNSIIAAQHQHIAVFDGYEIETDGNPYAHLVMRGGNGMPNYQLEFLETACNELIKGNVKNPSIIMDVSHDNCLVNGKKDHNAQAHVIFDVLNNMSRNPEIKKMVKGFMLESFIKSGNQNIEKVADIDMGGLSITDPCMGWKETEDLVLKLAELL